MEALQSESRPRVRYNVALAYLRTFAVILVLAHHSALAYFPRVPLTKTSLLVPPRLWKAFPILDSRRAIGFVLFTVFNDMFFMSLLFFLSGLFVWSSLQRKGTRTFMRDRMVRLALPFVFAAAIVAPLAYYPAYAIRNDDPTVAGFIREWLSQGGWPTGPAWFVWVLLMFDCIAAAIFVKSPKFGGRLGELSSNANRHPARFFLLLLGLSALLYIPIVIPWGRTPGPASGRFNSRPASTWISCPGKGEIAPKYHRTHRRRHCPNRANQHRTGIARIDHVVHAVGTRRAHRP